MDEGQIEVANMDIFKSKLENFAKILTILRQENHFITRLTVRKLAGFERFPYSKGRLTKEDEAIVSKYIDFLDFSDLENRYLDDPLNNLDVAHSVQMMEHLRCAANEFGRTILTVMHDINFAAKYSDRICAMKDGRTAAFEAVKDIMNPKLLTDIFETGIEIIEGPYGPIAIY